MARNRGAVSMLVPLVAALLFFVTKQWVFFLLVPIAYTLLGTLHGGHQRDLRCDIPVVLSEKRHFHLQFMTRKTETGWIWVCPSIEVVAEDEMGLIDLLKKFKAGTPAHLAHLAHLTN